MPLWILPKKLVAESVGTVRPVEHLNGDRFVVGDSPLHPEKAFVRVIADTILQRFSINRKRVGHVVDERVINVQSLRIDEQALCNNRRGEQPSAAIDNVCRASRHRHFGKLLLRCVRSEFVGLLPLHNAQSPDDDGP